MEHVRVKNNNRGLMAETGTLELLKQPERRERKKKKRRSGFEAVIVFGAIKTKAAER